MYGLKAMNLAFCAWVFRQRKRNLLVMFHEVAYPFKPGQPWKHDLLAVMHRLMAWVILRSARHSFTSIASYEELLRSLAPRARIRMLGIFSNVPFYSSSSLEVLAAKTCDTVGIFSSFGSEINEMLDRYLPTLLANPSIRVLLIGPAAPFIERFAEQHPPLRNRLTTTGRVSAGQAGRHFESCNVLLQLYPDGAAGARGTFMAALASRVPVVTTAGRLTDPILKSSGAIVFAESNPEAVSRAVDELLADKPMARALGLATRRFYETHFGVGVTVARLKQAASESSATAAIRSEVRSA
jgi:glycosyltransferase involved in cell wall biosynthesis